MNHLATEIAASSTALTAVDAPRTWSFTDRDTGEIHTVTCMDGCTNDHTSDSASPTAAEDVWCTTTGTDNYLPVNSNGTPEEVRIMSAIVKVEPFSTSLAARLPHVAIEIVGDHWVEGLDPDALLGVIRFLDDRVNELVDVHAQLVQARAEYRGRK